MKHIVIDIDQTVVDTASSWWEWMEWVCMVEIDYPVAPNYDLSSYFVPHYAAMYAKDGLEDYEGAADRLLEYWSIPTLYSGLNAYEGCSEALQRLSEKGWWITFASYTKKGHFGSKFDFLEREFPFIEWGVNGGFVATKEKGCILADVFVDDRNSHLNQFKERPEVMKIRYDTPYTQEEPLRVDARYMRNWGQLENIVGGLK